MVAQGRMEGRATVRGGKAGVQAGSQGNGNEGIRSNRSYSQESALKVGDSGLFEKSLHGASGKPKLRPIARRLEGYYN